MAERWAAWEALEGIYDGNLQRFYKAFNLLFPGVVSCKGAFANKYAAYKGSTAEVFIDDARLVTKAQKRTSGFIERFLMAQYVMDAKPAATVAHARLVEACQQSGEKPVSLSTVKNLFADFRNNLDLFEMRYGSEAAQKQRQFSNLGAAQHRNTMWSCDGWTLPFWVKTVKGFERFVLYTVRDDHSRRIVGWSIASSENTVMILAALEDAMRATGCVPSEIITDNHSFNRTQAAADLKTRLTEMGVTWTVTMNAQYNSTSERGNQYLQAICAEFTGYTGKGVKSKSEDALPKPEALMEYGKAKNQKTEEEIKAIAAYVVGKYNDSPLKPLAGLTPNAKYAQSTDAKAFAITEAERVALLRPAAVYTVRRGQITITLGGAKHDFQLSAELFHRYNNRELGVVYEDLAQGIYIYDTKTGEALGSIGPKPIVSRAMADQTEEDVRRLHQQAGRTKGTTTKARKAAIRAIAEGLEQNPEAIELVNHYSIGKDVRKVAQEDADARRWIREAGARENMLPIRAEAAPALEAIAPAARTKESPFTNPGKPMRLLTLEELYPPHEDA